jgi:hypothetical protein
MATGLARHTAPAHSIGTSLIDVVADDPVVDPLPLLDHRTRTRTITPRMAKRGVYLALRHGDEEKLIALEPQITHLGRSLTSHVRFDAHTVSRTHAIIVRHGRHARILDNRSVNGTYLNGRRILATNLQNGDVIRLGPVAMQYLEIG